MGIVSFGVARLVMAVPAWLGHLERQAPWRSGRSRPGHEGRLFDYLRRQRRARHESARSAQMPANLTPQAQAPAARPLRVLRIVDAGHPQGGVGRLVISGRMADVCAELDRLVAAEDAAARR